MRKQLFALPCAVLLAATVLSGCAMEDATRQQNTTYENLTDKAKDLTSDDEQRLNELEDLSNSATTGQ